ncbi:MAG: LVIVD repeat-containing protein [Promethearchaeota archaeon]
MKTVLKLLIVISFITSVVTSGMANSDELISCEEISQLDTGGGAYALTISDNYLYVCDSLDDTPGGLVIIDISDPTNPIKIESFDGGFPLDVTVRNNIAYVADFTDGLEIINVSDPSNPVLLGSYNPLDDMYTTCVKVLGDYAYVGDIHHGLFKVNIADPSNPTYVGSIPYYSCPSLDVSPDLLITVNHQEFQSGLEIYEPENFHRLGTYTPSDADFINPVINGDLVFVVNHHLNTGEVQIINISDPSNPILLSQYTGDSIAQQCFVDKDILYVACSEAGIDILDISNPAQPKKIGSYSDNTGVAFDVHVKNDIAYVADARDGLEIIRLAFKDITSIETMTSITTTTKQVFGFLFLTCILVIPYLQYLKKRAR